MGKALYRTYRSRSLDDIVGQDHVTNVLRRAIATDRVAHAYLFTGPRGVGKTSIARIVAHEINGLPYTDESNYLDIIEIDAASNNGVEDIRELREKVQLAPLSAKKKVYIIDEVHMLSKAAFNALLKTLEEPPEHVVFILATTDIEKLPDTIISRTQRHTFRRASNSDIIKNLKRIAKKESLRISNESLDLVAEHSDGSYRDSVSLLDQLASVVDANTEIRAEDVEASLGLARATTITTLISHIEQNDFEKIIELLRTFEADGIQAPTIASQLIAAVTKNMPATANLLPLIDRLLEVGSSSMPQVKLMTAIALHITPVAPTVRQPAVPLPIKKSQPLTVTIQHKNATIISELEKKATEESPIDDLVTPGVETSIVETPTTHTPKKRGPNGKTTIDWPGIILYTKDHSIGLHSVLAKCSVDCEDGSVTVYCKNEFYKKKLDTPRYRQALQDALGAITDCEWDIITIASNAPSKNEHVASVAAIMGGGEEVSVDA